MLLFAIIEILLVVMQFINFFFEEKNHHLRGVYTIIFYSGNRLILQAFGFIFIKKNDDPLQGINQLDYIKVVSIN